MRRVPRSTLQSITGTNDGTNLTFTLTFANPTIEGPSSGNDDSVYGFINLDTDKNANTGVSGQFLDSNNFESGFGQYSPASQGIDAYINLSSEGDPLHGVPGLVDLVTTNGFNPIATLPVSYVNGAGNTPSTLSFSIALSVFSGNQIPLSDTGRLLGCCRQSERGHRLSPFGSRPGASVLEPLARGCGIECPRLSPSLENDTSRLTRTCAA